MEPGLLRDSLTVLAGAGTGVMSALFGVGGAVISTPAIRALGASAAVSIGSTLPAIIPGAASGTIQYARKGLVDWRLVAKAGPVGALAAIGGSLLSKAIPGDGHVLMLLTAALLGFSAWRISLPPRVRSEPPGIHGWRSGGSKQQVSARVAFIGGFAGLLSGLLGVGGGIILVPGFSSSANVPIKQAIATSLACVAIFSIPSTITHAVQGDIAWGFALLLALGVVPGARLGAALSVRTSEIRLRRLVAVFLGLTAVVYAAGEIRALF